MVKATCRSIMTVWLLATFVATQTAAHAGAAEPGVFIAEAHAVGGVVSVDRSNQIPFTPTLEQATSRSHAKISSNREELAIGAFYDPGELVLQGPGLLPLICETTKLPVLPVPVEVPLPKLDCPALPEDVSYPFYARADGTAPGPMTASMADPIDLGGLLTIDIGQATAQVGEDGRSASAHSSFGGGTSLALPAALSMGSSVSHSDVHIIDGRLVASAVTKAFDVVVAGALEIGEMRVEVRAEAVPGGAHVADVITTYSDVVVGGTPVEVTPEGLVLGEDAEPQGTDVVDQLAAVLDFTTGQIRARVEFSMPQIVEVEGESVTVHGGGFSLITTNADPLGEMVTTKFEVGRVNLELKNPGIPVAAAGAPQSSILSAAPPASQLAAFDIPSAPVLTARPANSSSANVPVDSAAPVSTVGVAPSSSVLEELLDLDLLRALYSLLATAALATATLAGWRSHSAARSRREQAHVALTA